MKKIIEFIKRKINAHRCKVAIKKADELAITTGCRHLVLMHCGKPMVISKKRLKQLIYRDHAFGKGFTIAIAEEIAIHRTK